jgi:maleylacetoacetate isomerase
MTLTLYSFANSSTSYRVRIALALKGVAHDYVGVDIRTGAHREAGLAALAATPAVPVIAEGDFSLGQSLAIIDWLDARFPEPRLIPAEADARARVLECAQIIACDIHPVNNLRIRRYLTEVLKIDQAAGDAWYAHWITEGLAGVERLIERHGYGTWCFGDTPSLADCCLIPQLYNARRTGCDLAPYPRLLAIDSHAAGHPAFLAAAPANQPDFG